MPLVFFPYVIFPFVFSKLIAFQVLIGLTFPAYAALAWMEPRYRPPKALMYYAILAYFVALALSTVFSVDPARSWWGNQERMNGLFTLLHLLAWLTMAVGLLKSWEGWKRLLNYEIVLSVFMALVALLQLVKKDLLFFPAGPRVGGLLDNPIYMGAYQIFNLSFLALLCFKTKSNALRAWYVAAAIVNLSAFFAAQSRGALVGLAATIGVFALYYGFFTKSAKARWGILGAAGAAFASYVVIYLLRGTEFVASNGILSRLTNFNFTTQTRFIAWKIAWEGFLERPLTGWGLDNFHILFNLKYNPRSLEFGYYETWFDRAHNTVLDVLSMTGLIGFLTFFAIFATLFVSVWVARKKGWIDLPIAAILTALPVGYFLQNLFVFDHPAAFSMSYLLFAFVIVATRPGFMESHAADSAAGEAPKSAKGHAAPWATFAIVQAVFLIIVWQFSVQPARASLATIHHNRYFTVTPAVAWESIQRAGSIATPYRDEQTFLLSRNISALAMNGDFRNYPDWKQWIDYTRELSKKNLAMHPRNTHYLFAYARFLQDSIGLLEGEEQREALIEAEQVYHQAIQTSPKRQQLLFGLAQLYSMAQRPDKTAEVLQKTVEYNENIGEAWWYLGLTTWLELNKEEEGKAAILRAMHASVPYELKRVRDALNVAEAAADAGDTEVLQRIFPTLSALSGGSVQLYTDIAKEYERAGLIEERNTLVNAIQEADPSTAAQFQALRNGEAQTIDASMQAAEGTEDTAATSTESTEPGL